VGTREEKTESPRDGRKTGSSPLKRFGMTSRQGWAVHNF
jgi:hypothetical protein